MTEIERERVFVRMPDTLLMAACLAYHEVTSRKAIHNETNQSKSNNAVLLKIVQETSRPFVECLNNGNGKKKKKERKKA